MTITPDQIHKIASLAKLRIDDDSIDAISAQFDTIMALIDQMEQAQTAGVEPLSHPQDPILRLRDDEVIATDRRDAFMRLTEHNQDGLYLVPKVIE